MKKLLFFCLLQLSISVAFADPELIKHFSKTFNSNYEAGRCGDNILQLLERAEKLQINLNGARIIEITNTGNSVFGMLNVEFARESGRLNPQYPASGPRNLPGERNWYHHVVLEKDGLIYDYDFGNDPKVVPVKTYFHKMFLEEKKRSEGGEFYVGPEEKLKYYELLLRPGRETLQSRRDRQSSPTDKVLRLEDYLRDFTR